MSKTSSAVSTPQRTATRPPSVASSDRRRKDLDGDGGQTTSFGTSPNPLTIETRNDPEQSTKELNGILAGLKGFQRLNASKGDEWEVIDDNLPVSELGARELPGAFPQGANSDVHMREPPERPSRVTPTPSQWAAGPDDLVKPLFCVHYSAGVSNLSVSTLNGHNRSRSSFNDDMTRRGSVSSSSGRWWTANGSSRRWSGMSLSGPRCSEGQEEVDITFVEGKFALPSTSSSLVSPKRHDNLRRKKTPGFETAAPHDTPATSDNESTDDEDNDTASEWSNTQRPGSQMQHPGILNLIISGGEDDLPREKVREGKISIVGGTITISGIRSEAERMALQKILQNLLFTIQAMVVELELLDAFRIPRESDPLPLPPKPLGIRQKSTPPPSRSNSPSLKRNSSLRERGDRTRGFFQRLGKDTKGMFEGLMGKNRNDSAPSSRFLDAPAPIANVPGTVVSSTAPATPSSDTTGLGTPPVSQAMDRHLQTLQRLEKILPSTTPGLQIPMPPLLLRVQEEDRVRNEKAQQEFAADNTPIEGLGQPRVVSNDEDHLWGRARGYRMGGDVRAGLCSLMSGIDGFGGWNKLQRLETLVSTGIENGDNVTVCERPQPASYVFWGHGDQTVTDFINSLGPEQVPCTRQGCEARAEDHMRWWFHWNKKVAMRVKKLEEGMGEIGMDVWVTCGECGRKSESRALREYAAQYSWAKLLELLLYTNILQPQGICDHSTPTYNIRTPHLIASLSVKPISVLDTRLPKLQVGPNVAKRKAGKAGVEGTVQGLLKRADREKDHALLQVEVKNICLALRQRVELLGEALGPPTVPPKENGDGPINEEPQADPKNQEDRSNQLGTILTQINKYEVSLGENLDKCPAGQENDIRQQVTQAVAALREMLENYEKKYHEGQLESSMSIDMPMFIEDKKVHAPPGSSILIREDEPSSIVAYTLSSIAYFTELSNTRKASDAAVKTEGAETSEWKVEVIRKDTPRDLLSLRTIAKKRSDASIAGMSHRLPLSLPPNQPSLELSLEQVEGKSQGSSDRLGDLVRNISKATAQDSVLSMKTRSPSMSESDVSTTSTPASRFSPMSRRISDTVQTAPPSAFRPTRSVSSTIIPTVATPSLASAVTASVSAASSSVNASPIPNADHESASGTTTPLSVTPNHDTVRRSSNDSKEGWSSVTSTFTNSLNSLLRIGSEVGSIKVRGTDRSLSSLIGPLTMMSSMDDSLSSPNIDDRPHIQFTFTLPDRIKFGCTVYYATAFDSLRRRCAIDKSLIESLSRCENWDAQGGKSKASFFMTKDKKYIVKELVSKWNVSDTQALLEIAPSYFEHLAGTHNRATSLAKIVGFYTVKIHDLQTSTKKAMDLLVMENLFYNQTISQTYDLKGIEGRKVPKTMIDGTTLFDNEWIEGQARAPILLYPHAKRVLQEAVSNDTRFLCSQSIMDYSLLLGLDMTKKELVVGLVDAIGSYNLFKTIESRGKLALTRGGEVTIIPPDQYKERFENALKQYFMACPDKWSKIARRVPFDDTPPSIF